MKKTIAISMVVALGMAMALPSGAVAQLAQYLETARETEPFNLRLFDGDEETDPEEIEDMRRDDIRQCTRDLLLVERARDWFLENS